MFHSFNVRGFKILVKQDNPDWNDPALSRWLDPMTKQGTKALYRVAYRRYAQFTNMTA